jgi:Site-specific recombinase XerD
MRKANGYIYRRKGILYIAYPDARITGGVKRESTGGNSRRDAKRLLEQRLEVAHNRALGWVDTNAFYKRHFTDFLKLYREGSETHKSYRGVLKLFIAFLDEKHTQLQYLHEFKPKVFDDYKVWLKDTKHKDWTIKNHLKVLKTVFRKAEEWESIQKAPKINTAVSIEDAKPIVTLSDESQMQRFLEICKEIKPEYHPFYFTAVRTGLRFGEMVGLLWQNVSFEEHCITVKKTPTFIPKGRNKRTGLPKERPVPLTNDAVAVLKAIPRSSSYRNVFLRNGKPIDKAGEKNLRYWLKKIVKLAGIDGMTRLHELRHSAGQLVYDKTRDLYVVKEFLGHSDIRMTERYAGKPTKQVEEAVRKLDGFGTK